MISENQCPVCESFDTKKVHQENIDWDAIEITLICNKCPTQFRLIYGYSHKEVD